MTGARRPGIEGLRLAGAFGAVWFAMQAPGFRVGYASLGLFAILGAFFAARVSREAGAAPFLRARRHRLGLPWLVWSGFYLCVNAALLRDPVAALTPRTPLALLIGPSPHLWFLPFLLIVSVVMIALEPVTREARGRAGLVVLGIPIAVGCFWIQTFVLPPAPFAQWCYAIPCVIFGVLSAQAKAGGGWRWAPLGFIAVVAAISYALGATEDVAPALLAAVLFEAVWRFDPPGDWMRAAGGLAYGTYLAHPVFLLVYYKLFPGANGGAVAALFVFGLSLAAAAALKRLPATRRLV